MKTFFRLYVIVINNDVKNFLKVVLPESVYFHTKKQRHEKR